MTVADQIEATITALQATLTDAGITVLEAPTADNPQQYALVGWDNPDNADQMAVTGDFTWAYIGHTTYDGMFTISVTTVGWNGDSLLPQARTDALACMSAVETAVKADPTLGGVILFASTFTGVQLRQVNDSQGSRAYCHFGLECRIRV